MAYDFSLLSFLVVCVVVAVGSSLHFSIFFRFWKKQKMQIFTITTPAGSTTGKRRNGTAFDMRRLIGDFRCGTVVLGVW